jgi:hypothetical protein
MALITKTYTFSAGATILASEHNTNLNTLYNWANGNVDNANIKASAGISLSKLSLGDDVTFTGDFNFTNAATADDIVTVTGSSLTTGSALKVYSNSSSTSARNLVEIINDHADADDTVGLLIQQDGADYAIDCGATGKIRGDLTDSTFPATQVAIFNDTKAAGTDGGTFTSGDWRTRDLNTEVYNAITGASLASNQITLPAGTYVVEAAANAYGVDTHRAKLRNVTDSTDYGGLVARASGAPGVVSSSSHILAQFTITEEKVFEIQHYCTTTNSGNGFGNSYPGDISNIYTQVKITKLTT